jgi:hypothetical protein
MNGSDLVEVMNVYYCILFVFCSVLYFSHVSTDINKHNLVFSRISVIMTHGWAHVKI